MSIFDPNSPIYLTPTDRVEMVIFALFVVAVVLCWRKK